MSNPVVDELTAERMKKAEKAAFAVMAGLEPDAIHYGDQIQVSRKELALISIAISLKRLADSLEHMAAVS